MRLLAVVAWVGIASVARADPTGVEMSLGDMDAWTTPSMRELRGHSVLRAMVQRSDAPAPRGFSFELGSFHLLEDRVGEREPEGGSILYSRSLYFDMTYLAAGYSVHRGTWGARLAIALGAVTTRTEYFCPAVQGWVAVGAGAGAGVVAIEARTAGLVVERLSASGNGDGFTWRQPVSARDLEVDLRAGVALAGDPRVRLALRGRYRDTTTDKAWLRDVSGALGIEVRSSWRIAPLPIFIGVGARRALPDEPHAPADVATRVVLRDAPWEALLWVGVGVSLYSPPGQ